MRCNWFGTAGWRVNYAISYHPTALATTKVLAVVLGHVNARSDSVVINATIYDSVAGAQTARAAISGVET